MRWIRIWPTYVAASKMDELLGSLIDIISNAGFYVDDGAGSVDAGDGIVQVLPTGQTSPSSDLTFSILYICGVGWVSWDNVQAMWRAILDNDASFTPVSALPAYAVEPFRNSKNKADLVEILVNSGCRLGGG